MTRVFYFWIAQRSDAYESKITIQQLYSPWFKKKKRKERNSLCNAQEKLTALLSLRQALAITMGRRGGGGGERLSDQTRGTLKKKDSPLFVAVFLKHI